MGSQMLDQKTGQPEFLPEKKCPHGVWQDERGNSGCEECFETKLTENYLNGVSVGIAQMSSALYEKSGKAFATGKDEAARQLRDLAREMDVAYEKACAEVKRYKKEQGLE